MKSLFSISPQPLRARPRPLRDAVLAVLSEPSEDVATRLASFSERDWQADLQWLDSSGLALYLLARLTELNLTTQIPPAILNRLRQNLRDNTERNAGLFAEAAHINERFASEGLLFANLKGFTLSPESVPDRALRCQLDLDFLILTEDAAQAAHQLEDMGYQLDCISGDTWEFKAGASSVASMKDLYKPRPQRAVELHLASAEGLLARAQMRRYEGIDFPVLAPADLFLAQALHLFKHVASAFTRAAWLLEFHRHLRARAHDDAFWAEVQLLLAQHPTAARAIALVSLLAGELFGAVPTRLVAPDLSAAVQLWVRLYGRAAILADFPGTKLYRLLEAELNPASTATRTIRLSAPPMITQAQPGERLANRVSRYRTQAAYILFRMRFHCVEGLRYNLESTRFRRHLAGLSR